MDEEIFMVVGDATKVALVVLEKIILHFGGDRVIRFLPTKFNSNGSYL